MKYIGKYAVLLSLISVCSSQVLAGWEKEKEEKDMSAECQIHKSGYKYCKILAVTDYSMAELVGINTDPDNLFAWMDTVKSSEQVEHKSDIDYVNCMKYTIPYPFNDRESCTRSKITLNEEKTEVKIEFKSVKLFVDNFDLDNMEYIFGYWKFTSLENGRNQIEYATIVLPGGNLVPILYNTKALDVPWDTVNNMFKVLKTGKYKDIEISFLNNNKM